MVFEIAGFPVVHASLDVSSQVTKSLLAGAYEYVALFVPAFNPFTFHWYEGEVPPFMADAVKSTVVPAHTGFAEAMIERLTGRSGLTVIVTGVDTAGLPETQVSPDVKMQVITSLLAGEYEKTALLVPTGIPLRIQRNEGVNPPFTGVAVKETETPLHTGLALAETETLTGSIGFTVIVTLLDVAGLPLTQVSLEVNSQVTTSPLTGL